MNLVDKQDDPAFGFFDFVEHCLQPLLKFAAELRPRDQGAHIQRIDGLILQPFGNVAIDDALSKPFHHRGFSHARLADEHGVVFRAARQNLHGVADFRIPANDRIELALPGKLH